MADTNKSTTEPSTTGPSTTGPSTTGPSTTGPSTTSTKLPLEVKKFGKAANNGKRFPCADLGTLESVGTECLLKMENGSIYKGKVTSSATIDEKHYHEFEEGLTHVPE